MFKFKEKYDELMERFNRLEVKNNKLTVEIDELKEKFKYVEIKEKIIFSFYDNWGLTFMYDLYFIDSNFNEIKLNSYNFESNMKLKEYFIKKINNDIIIGVQFNENEKEFKEYFIFNQNDKIVKKIDTDLFTEINKSDNNYNWIEYKGER